MNRADPALLLLALSLALPACGSNAPPPTSPAAASSSTTASSATPAASGDPEGMHHDAPRPPPAGQTVTVTFDGHQVDVDVAKVANGAATAPILAVWKQAFPTADASGLTFDFVGSDGFRPSLRPACAKMLGATEMAQGKVAAGNHDLAWDDTLKLPRCYNVKALSRLEAKK